MDLVNFINLLGSLGLFLFGMKIMSDALMSLTGHRMRRLMVRLTANRFSGILTGLTITGLIQSSSATTLMILSFVNAQLLSLTEAIGVIMGANIGTTLTAWLITIFGFKMKIDLFSVPLMFVGFVLYMMKPKGWHYLGKFIAGFALLFMGLAVMQTAVPDLQQNSSVFQFLKSWSGHGFLSLIIFIGVGTLLTLVLQSSSATMAITLVAAAEGLINFEAAAAMVLGENIGTTIKAILAALVANIDAKRTAAAHFLFNVIGVLWMLVVFSWFIELSAVISEYFQGASPLQEALAVPLGLSIFHTCFNLLNTLVLVGFVPLMAKVVTRLIPDKSEQKVAHTSPMFLQNSFLRYPETAIHGLLRESRRLYRMTLFEAICHGLNFHREDIISTLPPQQVVHKSSQKLIPISAYESNQSIPRLSILRQKLKPIWNWTVSSAPP
jgi:phosphate:Na+ symporter